MPKRNYVVLTDSACDLPKDLAEKYPIDIMSFELSVDGKSYTERVDFDFDEYYELLRTCEGIPTTSQITSFRFLEQFEKYFKEGIKEVLYISINAGGSATNASAHLAKNDFAKTHPDSEMNITIIDSHTYSMVYGWHVAEAASKLMNGAEMRDVVDWLEDRFARMEIILASYTLRFLKKSGRVSSAAAFAGELLGLRPIISLTDGISITEGKVRGDGKVIPALIDYADARISDTREYMIVGASSEKATEDLAALCKKKWKAEPMGIFKVGAAVATNTGPEMVAIVYVGEKRNR